MMPLIRKLRMLPALVRVFALLEAGLRLVDAHASSDCYLETSEHANVPFYERFGFTVTAPDLRLVPNGPSHVAMRRRSPRAPSISPA